MNTSPELPNFSPKYRVFRKIHNNFDIWYICNYVGY